MIGSVAGGDYGVNPLGPEAQKCNPRRVAPLCFSAFREGVCGPPLRLYPPGLHGDRADYYLAISEVAGTKSARYSSAVAAKSATGCESPKQSRRKAPQNLSWRFFSSAIRLYGGCAWETFGSTGCLDCRFLTPRTAVTQAREKARDSSSNQGC